MWWPFLGCAPPAPTPVIDVSPDRPDTTDTLFLHVLGEASAATWSRDGQVISYGDRVPPEATRRGEEWRVELDGATEAVTIGNAVPVLAAVALSPEEVRAGTELRALPIDGVDADGDPLEYRFEWTVDGQVRGSGPTFSGDFVHDARVEVTAWPDDGFDPGGPVRAGVVVANTPPRVAELRLAPELPTVEDEVVAEVVGEDADGDVLQWTFSWSVDGEPQPDEGPSVIGFPKHSVLAVEVQVDDGREPSDWRRAETVVVNTPPTVSGVRIEPDPVYTSSEVGAIGLGWVDPDGDPEGYHYAWTLDGEPAGAEPTPDRSFSRGDRLGVTLVPDDGDQRGSPVTSEIVVRNSPPGAPEVEVPAIVAPFEAPLRCMVTVDAVDPDGDPVTYEMSWTVDGAPFTGSQTTEWPGDTVPAGEVSSGDWVCSAIARDDADDGASGTARTAVREHANVLVIVLDDVSTFWIGAYDELSYGPVTPNLDALADRGLLFRNGYADTTCSPTRGVLLTGRHARRFGIGRWISIAYAEHGLPLAEQTVPEMLTRSPWSYTSAALGKWHLTGLDGSFDMTHPLEQGFDRHRGAAGNLQDYFDWTLYEDGVDTQTSVYGTTDTTDSAIDEVLTRPEPWFLWLAYNAPHRPWQAPPAPLQPVTQATSSSGRQVRYRAMIEAVDTEIGRLLDAVPADVLDRTTVFVIGDNGSHEDFVPDGRGKGTLYEAGVNVPFIVVSPHVSEPGTETAALAHISDLYPTVAELARVDVSGDAIDGVSLVPVLRDRTSAVRDRVYVEAFQPLGPPPYDGALDQRALLDERYKLYRQGDEEELFDLRGRTVEGPNLLDGTLTAEEQEAYDRLSGELDALVEDLVYDH